MSKGSGRRRISPSDGLQYDEETMMTNIEERGAAHYQSGGKELRLGLRTGASPTTGRGYGNHGYRWAGKGRKDDNRNWKSHTRGKQYEHNATAQEKVDHHKPVPASLAARLRERSIAVLLHEARRRQQSRRRYDRVVSSWNSNYNSSFRNPPQSEQNYPIGFAVFERKVKTILFNVKYGY